MKTALTQLIEDVNSMAQGLNEDELLAYFNRRAKELLKAEKEQITTAYAHGMAEGITFEITNSLTAKTPEQYYNLTYKSDE